MREHNCDVRAFEVIGRPEARGQFVFSCEHASNDVPLPLAARVQDQPWLDMHWGWDIGAEIVTRYLVENSDSVGILSTFSRLVCDPNRDLDNETLIPLTVEGYELSFNRGLDESERRRRITALYEPFHAALDEVVGACAQRDDTVLLISVHSFTPMYNGHRREMEMAVLFDDFEDLAISLAERIKAQGFVTALNEPYSGFEGMMPSANRHGRAHQITYLEIEIRQDLIDTNAKARSVAAQLLEALRCA